MRDLERIYNKISKIERPRPRLSANIIGDCGLMSLTGGEPLLDYEMLIDLMMPYANALRGMFSVDPWQSPKAEIWALPGGTFVARTKNNQLVERITKICRSLRDLEDTCETILSIRDGLSSGVNIRFHRDDYVAGMGGVFNGQTISPSARNLCEMLKAEVVTCILSESIFLGKIHKNGCSCYTEWYQTPGQMDEICWQLADAGLNIAERECLTNGDGYGTIR